MLRYYHIFRSIIKTQTWFRHTRKFKLSICNKWLKIKGSFDFFSFLTNTNSKTENSWCICSSYNYLICSWLQYPSQRISCTCTCMIKNNLADKNACMIIPFYFCFLVFLRVKGLRLNNAFPNRVRKWVSILHFPYLYFWIKWTIFQYVIWRWTKYKK